MVITIEVAPSHGLTPLKMIEAPRGNDGCLEIIDSLGIYNVLNYVLSLRNCHSLYEEGLRQISDFVSIICVFVGGEITRIISQK
jgi:hypothetical protein